MQTSQTRVISSVFALAAMMLLSAPSFARSTTVTGSGGQTATRNVSRSAGSVNSSTTVNGQVVGSRSVSRSASGASATVSGPNGKSASRTTTY